MLSFGISHIYRLIRIDLSVEKKTIFSTVAAVLVLVLLLELLSPGLAASENCYLFFLYIVGLMWMNRVFSDMHNPLLSCRYLSLPCSNLDRLIAKLLLSTIGLLLLFMGIFSFASWGSYLLAKIVWHNDIPVFSLFSQSLWVANLKFIIFQSVFLLGAAYFRKNSVTKTMLVIGCFIVLAILLLFFISYFWCANCVDQDLLSLVVHSTSILPLIYWVVLAPLCWVATYFVIAKKESC